MGYLDRRQDELGRMVTHRFPLERIAEGFEIIRSGAGLKVVVVP
jgi:Zn-dependent alcohol dehydrogenase